MTDDTAAPDDHDDLLRQALRAEADGVEASDGLLDRTLAAASRPAVRPSRRFLAAAAVAAIALGAGIALARDDDRGLDTANDPSSTTTSTSVPVDEGAALRSLFPCRAQDVARLSLFVDTEGVEAVRSALEADARTLEVVSASDEEVQAALAGTEQDGVLPAALSATFATGDDELEVRSTVADLPGVTTLSTFDCRGAPVEPVGDGERPSVVALVREDGWLVVVDLATGEERQLHFGGDPEAPPVGQEEGGPQFIDWVELSPDGRWVYFSTCCEPASGTTYRISTKGGEPELVGHGAYPRVSPDGRFVATAGSSVVSVHRVDQIDGSGTASVDMVDVGCCSRHVTWSPDGSQLGFISGTGAEDETPQAWLLAWDGTALSPADLGKPDNAGSFVSWLPDGTPNIVSGGPVADDRSLSQDRSYTWILWVDEEGVVRQQEGFESSDRTPIEGLPEALAADW
jgi:hypothetical protein